MESELNKLDKETIKLIEAIIKEEKDLEVTIKRLVYLAQRMYCAGNTMHIKTYLYLHTIIGVSINPLKEIYDKSYLTPKEFTKLKKNINEGLICAIEMIKEQKINSITFLKFYSCMIVKNTEIFNKMRMEGRINNN